MTIQRPIEPHYGAVVVGGGQAGLSASHHLKQNGVDHIVFEKRTMMHKWRDGHPYNPRGDL